MNQPPPGIVSFLPMFLIGIIFFFFLLRMARRKGKSWFVAFFAFVPFVNVFYALWLASLPEESILKRIDELERSLRIQGES